MAHRHSWQCDHCHKTIQTDDAKLPDIWLKVTSGYFIQSTRHFCSITCIMRWAQDIIAATPQAPRSE